jgi:hypothetical protein
MVWTMRRADGRVVEVQFRANTHLGESTNDLRDIFSCWVEAAPEIKLFFGKINTEEWRHDLQQFVWNIEEFCKRTGAD